MNKVKVALSIEYGSITMGQDFEDIMTKNIFPLNRTGEIVNHIETKGTFIWRDNANDYDVYEINCGYFGIATVDTSRPWTIVNYDGKEYIQYMDYEIIDKNLNYAVFKEDLA